MTILSKGKVLTTTTLRLENEQLIALKNKIGKLPRNAGEHKLSMNTLLAKWIESYLQNDLQFGLESISNDSVQSEQMLATLLADRVAELLRGDTDWAVNVVRTANLRWPTSGLLRERLAHYPMDKLRASETFSRFLSQRIQHLLDQEKVNVHLLLDAGSTIFTFCQSFWRHLTEISKKKRGVEVKLITNNLSAAESFADQQLSKRFDAGTAISCQLLGGTVQPKYAALTGEATVRSLNELMQRKKQTARFISLVAANYIRLDDQSQPAYPIPLIRGDGQREVKESYCNADEVYVLGATPGKIFDAPRDTINKALGLIYQDVEIPKSNRSRVKLVTTFRESEKAILKAHSAAIAARLGKRTDPMANRPDTPLAEISQMNHFGYPYDDPILGKSPQEQLSIEFPHLWSPEFERGPEAAMEIVIGFFGVKL